MWWRHISRSWRHTSALRHLACNLFLWRKIFLDECFCVFVWDQLIEVLKTRMTFRNVSERIHYVNGWSNELVFDHQNGDLMHGWGIKTILIIISRLFYFFAFFVVCLKHYYTFKQIFDGLWNLTVLAQPQKKSYVVGVYFAVDFRWYLCPSPSFQ